MSVNELRAEVLLRGSTCAGAFGKNGTDTALISDMKAYHDNLPEVDIFEGQTIIVKEVISASFPFPILK